MDDIADDEIPETLKPKLYGFYQSGLSYWSTILVAATVGTFSPLIILKTGFMLSSYGGLMLTIFYFIFVIISAYTSVRLLGVLSLSSMAMPTDMKIVHEKLVKKYDPFALHIILRIMRQDKKQDNIRAGIRAGWKQQLSLGLAVFILYFILYISLIK